MNHKLIIASLLTFKCSWKFMIDNETDQITFKRKILSWPHQATKSKVLTSLWYPGPRLYGACPIIVNLLPDYVDYCT